MYMKIKGTEEKVKDKLNQEFAAACLQAKGALEDIVEKMHYFKPIFKNTEEFNKVKEFFSQTIERIGKV